MWIGLESGRCWWIVATRAGSHSFSMLQRPNEGEGSADDKIAIDHPYLVETVEVQHL